MTKSQVLQLRAACWLTVAGFAAAAVAFGWDMHRTLPFTTPAGSLGLMCAVSVTQPLYQILSWGTPIGVTGVAGLGFLWSRGQVSGWAVGSAGTLVLGGTIGLLIFGFRFMHDILGIPLSDIVWWLKPFGA